MGSSILYNINASFRKPHGKAFYMVSPVPGTPTLEIFIPEKHALQTAMRVSAKVLVDSSLFLTCRPRKNVQGREIIRYGSTDFYEMKIWDLLDVRTSESERKTDIIPRPTTTTTAIVSRNSRSFSRAKRSKPVPFILESEI